MQGKRPIRSFRIRLIKLWNGKPDEILFHAHHYKVDDYYSGLSLNYDVYKTNGGELSKLKYLKAARQAIRKAIEEDIIPLMIF